MGVLFYLRSDGQYTLVNDTIMSVVLCIIKLCDVLIEYGRSFILSGENYRPWTSNWYTLSLAAVS